jgi:hypothetical protein
MHARLTLVIGAPLAASAAPGLFVVVIRIVLFPFEPDAPFFASTTSAFRM